jgi:hypothetical protein
MGGIRVSGRLFTVGCRPVSTSPPTAENSVARASGGPAVVPRGSWIGWHCARRLWIARSDGTEARAVTPDDGCDWGLADFVAAEEFDRSRGFWWSPDSTALLVARVDEAPVRQVWISDPARPDVPPRQLRYPAAGSPNAAVSLWRIDLAGTSSCVLAVGEGHPDEYLTAVSWNLSGALAVVIERRQRRARVLRLDSAGPESAPTVSVLAELTDDDWVDLQPGVHFSLRRFSHHPGTGRRQRSRAGISGPDGVLAGRPASPLHSRGHTDRGTGPDGRSTVGVMPHPAQLRWWRDPSADRGLVRSRGPRGHNRRHRFHLEQLAIPSVRHRTTLAPVAEIQSLRRSGWPRWNC